MADVNRRWLLKTRPAGMLRNEDFDFVKEPVPEPAEGEILVRVQMLSGPSRVWALPHFAWNQV